MIADKLFKGASGDADTEPLTGGSDPLVDKFWEKVAQQPPSGDAMLDMVKQQAELHKLMVEQYGPPDPDTPQNPYQPEPDFPGISSEVLGGKDEGDSISLSETDAALLAKLMGTKPLKPLGKEDAATTTPAQKKSANENKKQADADAALFKQLGEMAQAINAKKAKAIAAKAAKAQGGGQGGGEGDGEGDGEQGGGEQGKDGQNGGKGKEGQQSEAEKKQAEDAAQDAKAEEIMSKYDTLEEIADALHKELPDKTLWCRLLWPVTEIYITTADGRELVRQEYPVDKWCPLCGGNRQSIKHVIGESK